MSRRRPARASLLALTALLALSACSDSSPGTTAQKASAASSATLVVATGGEPETLNPVLAYGTDGGSLIFDGLVARDDRNALVPALAAALPTVSADGKTVTATLRAGVRFHDGSPLTSADVVFTYRSILNPSVDSVLRSDLDMLGGVSAPDAQTVVFSLKYAYAPFLQRLALGIVPEKALAGQDINKAAFNQKPIGTGAYRFVSWTPGDRMVLEANPDYWGRKPANARVVVAFVADDNVRAQRTQAGEFDAAELPAKVADSFSTRAGFTVKAVPSADYRGIMLPMKNPVTGDPAIRKALSAAVDRKALVTGILAGAGEPAFGPVPPSSPFYEPSIAGSRSADIAGATATLQAEGWLPGSDGIRRKAGKEAAFTLMYPASDSLRKELALAVTADAKKIGIRITPAGLTWDAIDPRMKNDALVMGWGTPYDPDFITYKLFGSRFAEDGYFNPGSYRSPAADAALERGRDSADPAVRKSAYSAFQKQLATDTPWLFLVYLKHTYVVKNDVRGVTARVEPHEHDVANSLWWNIASWTKG